MFLSHGQGGTSVLHEPLPPPDDRPRTGTDYLVLTIGIAFSLLCAGYTFGQSNHHVYLLDALRITEPDLLANDWFTARSFQYHVVFRRLTAGLMTLGVLEQGFFVGHLLTVLGLHVAWFRLTRVLGGTSRTYLLSVLLFYVSFAGYGLGLYRFLQDGCFLPSNVAAVAMLWGVYFWAVGSPAWAGASLGLAGAFHLNYAIVGVALWGGFSALWWRRYGRFYQFGLPSSWEVVPKASRRFLLGTLGVIVPCLLNVLFALRLTWERSGKIPFEEFIALYVRLRHPHHYDPSSWPTMLWVTILWPLPLAWWAWRQSTPTEPRRRAFDAFLVFGTLQVVALIGAGVWYFSETLVQMSLYRFSVLPKLLSCVAAAAAVLHVTDRRRRGRVLAVVTGVTGAAYVVGASLGGLPTPSATFVAEHRRPLLAIGLLLAVAMLLTFASVPAGRRRTWPAGGTIGVVALLAFVWPHWGLGVIRREDPAAERMYAFVRENTPRDAIFLIPPDDSGFRYNARRAAVVTFKHVPQLNAEIPVWRDRLEDVLALDDVTALPGPFLTTQTLIGERYDALPAEHLFDVARRYDARYVVTRRPLDLTEPLHEGGNGYFVYALSPAEPPAPPSRPDASPSSDFP